MVQWTKVLGTQAWHLSIILRIWIKVEEESARLPRDLQFHKYCAVKHSVSVGQCWTPTGIQLASLLGKCKGRCKSDLWPLVIDGSGRWPQVLICAKQIDCWVASPGQPLFLNTPRLKALGCRVGDMDSAVGFPKGIVQQLAAHRW